MMSKPVFIVLVAVLFTLTYLSMFCKFVNTHSTNSIFVFYRVLMLTFSAILGCMVFLTSRKKRRFSKVADDKVLLAVVISLFYFTTNAQQRTVLIEHFGNANCSTCATYTPQVKNFVENSNSEAIMIGYQINVPYSDGIYNENPTEVKQRGDYYGITGSPHTIMDGNFFRGTSASFLNQSSTKLNFRKAEAPKFSIAFNNLKLNGNNVNGSVVFESLTSDNANDSLRAFIAFVERRVLKSSYATAPGNNAETEYPYVMRKFFPDAEGSSITKRNQNEKTTIIFSETLTTIKDFEELRAIAFVQNIKTKEVYQAAVETPASIVNAISANNSKISKVAFNRATLELDIKLGKTNAYQLEVFNFAGAKVHSEIVTENGFLNVSTLPEGFYFTQLRSVNGKEIYTSKFIR